jgi:hypothetical protein
LCESSSRRIRSRLGGPLSRRARRRPRFPHGGVPPPPLPLPARRVAGIVRRGGGRGRAAGSGVEGGGRRGLDLDLDLGHRRSERRQARGRVPARSGALAPSEPRGAASARARARRPGGEGGVAADGRRRARRGARRGARRRRGGRGCEARRGGGDAGGGRRSRPRRRRASRASRAPLGRRGAKIAEVACDSDQRSCSAARGRASPAFPATTPRPRLRGRDVKRSKRSGAARRGPSFARVYRGRRRYLRVFRGASVTGTDPQD